ncbi:hypothetical protein V1289_006364 [Bradyrhizobium sp. AZCC 2289]
MVFRNGFRSSYPPDLDSVAKGETRDPPASGSLFLLGEWRALATQGDQTSIGGSAPPPRAPQTQLLYRGFMRHRLGAGFSKNVLIFTRRAWPMRNSWLAAIEFFPFPNFFDSAGR